MPMFKDWWIQYYKDSNKHTHTHDKSKRRKAYANTFCDEQEERWKSKNEFIKRIVLWLLLFCFCLSKPSPMCSRSSMMFACTHKHIPSIFVWFYLTIFPKISFENSSFTCVCLDDDGCAIARSRSSWIKTICHTTHTVSSSSSKFNVIWQENNIQRSGFVYNFDSLCSYQILPNSIILSFKLNLYVLLFIEQLNQFWIELALMYWTSKAALW